jgi:fumarate hydratase class I
VLDGSGPVYLDPPSLDNWPKLTTMTHGARRVNLDTVTRAEAATWKPGEVLLLTGKLLTGRDAAHKRMTDMLSRGEKLPVDFRDRFIYYVGPVDPVREEVIGPAGPTTATRMDKFTRQMLAETGCWAWWARPSAARRRLKPSSEFGAVYLMAVGGAAYLVSKAIHGARACWRLRTWAWRRSTSSTCAICR